MATRGQARVVALVPVATQAALPALDELQAVAALSALSQKMRLRAFRALVGAGPDGMTPGAMATLLGLPASTLSFHLKELLQAGLATQERSGRSLIYRASIVQMNALLAYLTAHCCQGLPCEVESPVVCQSC